MCIRRSLLFLLVLLGALWLLTRSYPARAQAAPKPAVAGIAFSGLARLDEARLRDLLKLKVGEPFTPQQMEADRKTILATGFFRRVVAAQQAGEGGVQVTFRVVEWPQVVHLRVEGNTVVDTASIREVVSTQLGQVLCAPQLQDDVRSIERLYRERGYVARISPRLLEEATKSGILRFEILEVAIAEVQVEGGTPRQQRRAREVLRERPPALYQPEFVSLDQQRLLKIKGVDRAAVRVETAAPGKVRIRWLLNPPKDTPDLLPSPAS